MGAKCIVNEDRWRKKMLGIFVSLAWVFVLVMQLTAITVQADSCVQPSRQEGSSDLDREFANHKYAYVARVDAVLRPGVLADEEIRETTNLFVFQPPLKGSVPETLSYTLGKRCMPDFSDGAVYLIFSDDLSEVPTPIDVRPMLAYESGPVVEWMATWVADKHQSEPMLRDFAELQWTHRVLVVGGPEASADVVAELQYRRNEVEDRDLVWWVAVDGELHSNYQGRLAPELAQRLLDGDTLGEKSVLLIGKDGGIKFDRRYFNLNGVFARIDSMPMRVREMGE